LQFDDGEVLAENVAILSFIADRYRRAHRSQARRCDAGTCADSKPRSRC
jgi:glutathione S-transferase